MQLLGKGVEWRFSECHFSNLEEKQFRSGNAEKRKNKPSASQEGVEQQLGKDIPPM